jgi:hypothetical protein
VSDKSTARDNAFWDLYRFAPFVRFYLNKMNNRDLGDDLDLREFAVWLLSDTPIKDYASWSKEDFSMAHDEWNS